MCAEINIYNVYFFDTTNWLTLSKNKYLEISKILLKILFYAHVLTN